MSPRTSRTLPTIEPILLTPRVDPFDDPAWLFEPKYDGYRGLLYVTRNGCYFRSKRGNTLKRFAELCLWVREELHVREAILDGEVVALDRTEAHEKFGPEPTAGEVFRLARWRAQVQFARHVRSCRAATGFVVRLE